MLWLLYALLSAVFLSVAEIFQKKGLYNEKEIEFLSQRYFFSLLFTLVLIPFISFNIPLVVWLFVIVATAFGALGNFFKARVFKRMELSTAAPFFNFLPAFVATMGFLFLKEAMTYPQLMGITLLVFGAYIIEIDFKIHSILNPFRRLVKSNYIHFIFIALVFFALGSISNRKIVSDYLTPMQLLFLSSLFATINYFLFDISKYGLNGFKNIFKKGKKDSLFSAFFWSIERFFYFSALSLQFAGLVIAIKKLNSVFTTIGGGAFFKDKGLYLKSAACIVMFFGAYLIAS